MRPVPELERPRELGSLLGEALVLYRGHVWTFLALAAAIAAIFTWPTRWGPADARPSG